jgi:pimeloyl-ACP methyl ester carboxylesterase
MSMTSRRWLLKCLGLGAALSALGGARLFANVPAAVGERGYAKGPYGLVHYHDTQTGSGVPMVLLHQAPMSHRQFNTVYGLLSARGVRAIGIDTPGFGMSDPTPFVPQVSDWASSVIAVLDHLRISRADMVGHHTGSLIATEVSLQFPKRVHKVVLNGPFPITESERKLFLDDLQKSEVDFEYRADGSHLAESFVKRSKFFGPDADPRHITRMQVEKFQGFGPFWYGHNAAYRYDHASTLSRMTHPTLILTNTGDMAYPMAQRARQLRPDMAYVELPGGNVDIVDQAPEAWVEAVVAFTRRD